MAGSETPVEETPAIVGDVQSLRGCRVLAAEDIEVNRLVLEDILIEAGASVVFAENGKIAVDLVVAKSDAFDVVLMDVMMPVMDGYEAARAIRKVAPTLPVIGLTAYALAEERKKCLSAGMASHLTKPIDPKELIQSIRYAIRTADSALSSATRIEHLATESESAGDAGHSSALMENSDGGLIDWAYLEEWVGAKPGRLVRFVKAALSEQLDKPDRLRAASAANDASEIRKIAHGLRSVAGNLRAQRLMVKATEVERIVQDDMPGGCVMAGHLAATTDQFLAELANWLKTCGSDGDGTDNCKDGRRKHEYEL